MSTNHGGVAIVCVPGVRLSVIKLGVQPSSFELLCVRVESGSSKIVVALIYRPGSEDITSTFFDDLSETLDRVAVYRDPLYIVGDLNVRLDRPDDASYRRLSDLLQVYGFAVPQTLSTQSRGGILDVVATRCDPSPPHVTVYDAGLSDHHLLQWSVLMTRTTPPVVSVVRRPWHLLSVDALRAAVSASRLCQPDSWTDCSVDELADLYTSELTSLLDSLIPVKTVTIRRRPSDPWFDQECREKKRTVRQFRTVSPSPPVARGYRCLVPYCDASTVCFYDGNVSSSVRRKLRLRSRRRVSYGALWTPYWVADAYSLRKTSTQNNFIGSSMIRSPVSDPPRLTLHRRHLRRLPSRLHYLSSSR